MITRFILLSFVSWLERLAQKLPSIRPAVVRIAFEIRLRLLQRATAKLATTIGEENTSALLTKTFPDITR